jgi:hypothetical protein
MANRNERRQAEQADAAKAAALLEAKADTVAAATAVAVGSVRPGDVGEHAETLLEIESLTHSDIESDEIDEDPPELALEDLGGEAFAMGRIRGLEEAAEHVETQWAGLHGGAVATSIRELKR